MLSFECCKAKRGEEGGGVVPLHFSLETYRQNGRFATSTPLILAPLKIGENVEGRLPVMRYSLPFQKLPSPNLYLIHGHQNLDVGQKKKSRELQTPHKTSLKTENTRSRPQFSHKLFTSSILEIVERRSNNEVSSYRSNGRYGTAGLRVEISQRNSFT